MPQYHLPKFSLMNPHEVDAFEKMQQEVFRPASMKKVASSAQQLLYILAAGRNPKNNKKEGDAYKMQVKLSNMIKSSNDLRQFNISQYLEALSSDSQDPLALLAKRSLMTDTNKGIKLNELREQLKFSFTDGTKTTEVVAKHILVTKHNLDPDKFVLLPDSGNDALFLCETNNELLYRRDLKSKTNRSIDAITELEHIVIVWCMKYKGGTAAVAGSGQSDQGTTEGQHMSNTFESARTHGAEITFKGKPVLFANLVYGGQFTDPNRIYENERAFRLDKECLRSFNISLDRVKDVINFFDVDYEIDLDGAVRSLYETFGYDIIVSKGSTIPHNEYQKLMEWGVVNR